MQRLRIKQLLQELPANSPYKRSLPTSKNYFPAGKRSKNLDPALLDYAYFDRQFGWRYAAAFAESGQQLPMSAQEEAWINRAWDLLMDKTSDPIMEDVLAMEEPYHKLKRDLVKALLIIPDKTLEEIAEIVRVDEEVIMAYAALLFDVRDRLDEKDFIAKIVFPDGIQSEFRDDYITSEDLGQLMLKAAFRGGEPALYVVAGLTTKHLGSEFNTAAAIQNLESDMLANGNLLAQLGLLNQCNVPGINHAKGIIAASKKAGVQQKCHDDVVGLGAVGLAYSIASDVARLQSADIRFRNFARAKLAEQEAKAAGKVVPMNGNGN